jgi:hypothetical protein
MQTKGKGDIFNEILAEIFKIYIMTQTSKYRSHFEIQIDMTIKEQIHNIS